MFKTFEENTTGADKLLYMLHNNLSISNFVNSFTYDEKQIWIEIKNQQNTLNNISIKDLQFQSNKIINELSFSLGIRAEELQVNSQKSLYNANTTKIHNLLAPDRIIDALKYDKMPFHSPLSGEIIFSNESFPLHEFIIVYRVFEKNTPYFFISSISSIVGIYFPNHHIIILNNNKDVNVCRKAVYYISDRFLKYHKEVSYYTTSSNLLKVTNLLYGTYSHLGHTVLNEYPAYSDLHKNGLLENKTFVAGPSRFFKVSDLFDIQNCREESYLCLDRLFKDSLNKLKFLIKPSNQEYIINQDLSKRILKTSQLYLDVNVIPNPLISVDHSPVISFEIRNNDRICLNQIEVAVEVSRYLKSQFANPILLVCGWCSRENASKSEEELIKKDMQCYNEIKRKSEIEVFSLVGKSVAEKFCCIDYSDIHIGTFGGGTVFPLICNKPVIQHANLGWLPSIPSRFKPWNYTLNKDLFIVSENAIKNINSNNTASRNIQNYTCKPDEVIRLLEIALKKLT